MPGQPSWVRWFVSVAIPVAGLIPLAAYWQYVGRAPTLTPEEAKQTLDRPDADTVLVDVRPSTEYAASHLNGSVNWPFDEIMAVDAPDDIPERIRGKRQETGANGHLPCRGSIPLGNLRAES